TDLLVFDIDALSVAMLDQVQRVSVVEARVPNDGEAHEVNCRTSGDVLVVARLVWKSEKAHSSGCWLASPKPAARPGGHRRNAPWQSISSWAGGRMMGTRGRSAN